MGGLAGAINFRGDAPDPEVVARMSERQAHRGSDGSGSWRHNGACFAHQLRRVVPTPSKQPYVAKDLVVMLDGWIYDHQEVSRAAGGDASDPVDTHSIAEAWNRWGPEFPEHVEGEYAAAIWERESRTLTLVRDRLGVRPLFWARKGDRFAFASELPALREVPWVSDDFAVDHLSEYLSFQVVHAPRTLLREVYQVEPAHWLRVSADELKTRRYWRLQYAPPGTPRPREGDVIDGLQEAVARAVRRRVPSGIDTALYLSGGLGSTVIAAAARDRFLTLPSFSIAFADDPHPEAPFAGRVAGLLGLEHHDVLIGTPEMAAGFRPAVAALGHPIGNPASISQLALAKSAAERAKVVLSGDGGEELFGGRWLSRLGRGLRVASSFSRLPGSLRRPLSKVLGRSRTGRSVSTPPESYVLDLGIGGSDLFSAEERRRLLCDDRWIRPDVRQDVLRPFLSGLSTDPVNLALHGYLRSWLSEGDLARADRTSSAMGIDVRFPLLDREVLERAAALPGTFKLRRVGGSLHTRWPLRAMLSGVLPTPLLNRPKRGMPKPLDNWLAGPGRLFMEDRLSWLKRNPRGLFRPEALDDLKRGLGRSSGAGIRLWALFILDEWLRGETEAGAVQSG